MIQKRQVGILPTGKMFRTLLTNRFGYVTNSTPDHRTDGGIEVAFEDGETKTLHPEVRVEVNA
jgi:hypothetical protein